MNIKLKLFLGSKVWPTKASCLMMKQELRILIRVMIRARKCMLDNKSKDKTSIYVVKVVLYKY